MKLDELIQEARKQTGKENPEIRIVADGGFLPIKEVLGRDAYRDESHKNPNGFEKGNFACLEFLV